MTKAFEFRLEKLLEVRRVKEDAAVREFAAAQAAVAERNRIILELMGNEDLAKKELRAAQEGPLDMARIRQAGVYLVALERLLRREYDLLQELVKVEIDKRHVMTEARKRVRVLERAREGKLRLYRQDLDLQERVFLDEVGQNLAKGA